MRLRLLPSLLCCLCCLCGGQALAQAGAAAAAGQDGVQDGEQDGEQEARSINGRFRLQAAKADWAALLQKHIPEFAASSDAGTVTPAMIRKLRQDIGNILATEGYFSPLITFNYSDSDQPGAKLIAVVVDAGPRTVVASVALNLSGALAQAAGGGDQKARQRRAALQADWGLPVGQAFREDDWNDAKNRLGESLRADVYAAATLAGSQAAVTADSQRADLSLEIDSGPPFALGEMRVTGLQRYPAWLLQRFQPPQAGEPYARARLLDYQRNLQNSAYFASVAVGIDPDPAKAAAVPLEVALVERQARDLGFGAGYSTNTGWRSEVTYRDRNIAGQAWDLRSAVRIEQRRQLAYADIYLPPHANNYLDSIGVLSERSDLAGLRQNRNALGIKRSSTRGHLEQRLGLNLMRETIRLEGEAASVNRALVASIGWSWREVDSALAPRRGQIAQLDLALSDKLLFSDQRFLRTYAKYQRWLPAGKHGNFILRAEAGQVLAQDGQGIPEEYLFRTGGSTTVRGYGYQSLGIQHASGVSGGRVLGVASAEYDRWLQGDWGAAAFLDCGDAADSWRALSLRQGMGLGARYKTPAGPIALDLAYGRQSKKFRLDFSIAIAF
ncbi:MAG: BamA/TamA family outer membrane protein [Burkholderiales bacterium]|nr:BamA/TamA family outer membrane protein [Burkholderiales bacterium]